MYIYQDHQMHDFRKKALTPTTRKITFQKLHLSLLLR
jgi:hypothetical protein